MTPETINWTSWLIWLIPLMIWELVWKGLGLWRAGRNNQPGWFILILILNTAGILPIIYLLCCRKKNMPSVSHDMPQGNG